MSFDLLESRFAFWFAVALYVSKVGTLAFGFWGFVISLIYRGFTQEWASPWVYLPAAICAEIWIQFWLCCFYWPWAYLSNGTTPELIALPLVYGQ